MKRIREFRDWIIAAATLVGVVFSDDLRSALRETYSWFQGSARDMIVSTLENVAWIVWSLCAVWTLVFLTRITVRGLVGIGREIPYLWIKLKGAMGMSDIITRDEALKVIAMSAFFRSRQPQARRPKGLFDPLRSFSEAMAGESDRDAMMRHQFMRNLLSAFEDQRPGAVTQEGYERKALEGWLEELFAEEVRAEMGDIPRV